MIVIWLLQVCFYSFRSLVWLCVIVDRSLTDSRSEVFGRPSRLLLWPSCSLTKCVLDELQIIIAFSVEFATDIDRCASLVVGCISFELLSTRYIHNLLSAAHKSKHLSIWPLRSRASISALALPRCQLLQVRDIALILILWYNVLDFASRLNTSRLTRPHGALAPVSNLLHLLILDLSLRHDSLLRLGWISGATHITGRLHKARWLTIINLTCEQSSIQISCGPCVRPLLLHTWWLSSTILQLIDRLLGNLISIWHIIRAKGIWRCHPN